MIQCLFSTFHDEVYVDERVVIREEVIIISGHQFYFLLVIKKFIDSLYLLLNLFLPAVFFWVSSALWRPTIDETHSMFMQQASSMSAYFINHFRHYTINKHWINKHNINIAFLIECNSYWVSKSFSWLSAERARLLARESLLGLVGWLAIQDVHQSVARARALVQVLGEPGCSHENRARSCGKHSSWGR